MHKHFCDLQAQELWDNLTALVRAHAHPPDVGRLPGKREIGSDWVLDGVRLSPIAVRLIDDDETVWQSEDQELMGPRDALKTDLVYGCVCLCMCMGRRCRIASCECVRGRRETGDEGGPCGCWVAWSDPPLLCVLRTRLTMSVPYMWGG